MRNLIFSFAIAAAILTAPASITSALACQCCYAEAWPSICLPIVPCDHWCPPASRAQVEKNNRIAGQVERLFRRNGVKAKVSQIILSPAEANLPK